MNKQSRLLILLMVLVFCFCGCASKKQDEEKPGSIKGLITWQYNDFIGTKPDVGATIFLLPAGPDKELTDYEAESYFLGVNIPEGYYYAETNGNGNYEIQGVKPGNYYAVIVSVNTNRNLLNDEYAEFLKEKVFTRYFSKEKAEYFYTCGLGVHKYLTKDIKVESDVILDLSNDFGNTYI